MSEVYDKIMEDTDEVNSVGPKESLNLATENFTLASEGEKYKSPQVKKMSMMPWCLLLSFHWYQPQQFKQIIFQR